MSQQQIPVITFDGPSGSGKGTISQILARQLGWYYLDSGALYRAVAWGALHYAIVPESRSELNKLLATLQVEMKVQSTGKSAQVWVDGMEVSLDIRSEECSAMASKISAIPEIRAALLQRQRDMRKPPGLVTDGRDMGTVVFPDAQLKFFFVANAQQRAKRRYNQLKEMGIDVSLRDIERELVERDRRDENRDISPSKPAPDAVLLDTSDLSIDQTVETVLGHVRAASY